MLHGLCSFVVHMRPRTAVVFVASVYGAVFVAQAVAGLFGSATTLSGVMDDPLTLLVWVLALLVTYLVGLGWPVAMALHLQRTFGPIPWVKAAPVVGIYCFSIGAMGLLVLGVATGQGVISIVGFSASFVSSMLIFYILWAGAYSLVFAEQWRDRVLDRIAVAFVQILFLPFGVLYLQRRLQSVLPQGPGSDAGG